MSQQSSIAVSRNLDASELRAPHWRSFLSSFQRAATRLLLDGCSINAIGTVKTDSPHMPCSTRRCDNRDGANPFSERPDFQPVDSVSDIPRDTHARQPFAGVEIKQRDRGRRASTDKELPLPRAETAPKTLASVVFG